MTLIATKETCQTGNWNNENLIIIASLTWLADNNIDLLTPQNQPAPNEDKASPNNPSIIDENEPGIDPALLPHFHENWAPWLQPSSLSIEGLPKPIGFELWKTSGVPELVPTFFVDSKCKRGFVRLQINHCHCEVKIAGKFPNSANRQRFCC